MSGDASGANGSIRNTKLKPRESSSRLGADQKIRTSERQRLSQPRLGNQANLVLPRDKRGNRIFARCIGSAVRFASVERATIVDVDINGLSWNVMITSLLNPIAVAVVKYCTRYQCRNDLHLKQRCRRGKIGSGLSNVADLVTLKLQVKRPGCRRRRKSVSGYAPKSVLLNCETFVALWA